MANIWLKLTIAWSKRYHKLDKAKRKKTLYRKRFIAEKIALFAKLGNYITEAEYVEIQEARIFLKRRFKKGQIDSLSWKEIPFRVLHDGYDEFFCLVDNIAYTITDIDKKLILK